MTNLMTAQGGDFLAHRTQSSAFRRGGVVEVDRGATADMITTYSENALRLHGWASTHALPNRRASAPDTINAINFSDGEDAPRLHEWALAHASPNMDALALEKIRAAVIYCLVDSPATDLEGLDTGMILVGQNGETVNMPVPHTLWNWQHVTPNDAARRCESAAVSSLLLNHQIAAERALGQALEELAEIDAYAAECDLHPPSPKAKETAQEILEKIARAVPRDYAVSPWDDGVIVVHTTDKTGRRVSVYCDDQGGTSTYVVHSEGPTEESHRRSAENPPMDFIIRALKKMTP